MLKGIYPDQEIRQLTYMLFEEYLGWDKPMVHLSADNPVSGPALNSLLQAAEDLSTGKPIQYIIEKAWFGGLILKVNEHVLVPRPETEQLCDLIKTDLAKLQHGNFSILDIGTGSGCIAISLKSFFGAASVSAIDISVDALETAIMNAAANSCDINFSRADILDRADWSRFGSLSLIVSNPPYVLESEKNIMHRNVREFEPAGALFVSDGDPLVYYRAIAGFAEKHLEERSSLYFEINERFGEEVCELLRSHGFREAETLPDFHGKARFVKAIR